MSGHHPDSKTMFDSYIKIATALFVLTVLTWVAALDWVPKSWGEAGNTLHIAIGLLIAFVKASWYFMYSCICNLKISLSEHLFSLLFSCFLF